LTAFQGKLLEKVEELTLYTLAQQNEIESQRKMVDELPAQLTQQNETLKIRLSRLEAQASPSQSACIEKQYSATHKSSTPTLCGASILSGDK